jgi:hypothetical protein
MIGWAAGGTAAVAASCVASSLSAEADAVAAFLDLGLGRCVQPMMADLPADTSGMESDDGTRWNIPGQDAISLTSLETSCFVIAMAEEDAEGTDLLSGEVGEIAARFDAWADGIVADGLAQDSPGCIGSDEGVILEHEILAADPPTVVELEVHEILDTGIYSISITAVRGASARLCAGRASE